MIDESAITKDNSLIMDYEIRKVKADFVIIKDMCAGTNDKIEKVKLVSVKTKPGIRHSNI